MLPRRAGTAAGPPRLPCPRPPSRLPAPRPHSRQRPVPVPAARPAPPQLCASLHRLQPGHREKPPAPEINVCYEPRLLKGGAHRCTWGAVYRGRARLQLGLPNTSPRPQPHGDPTGDGREGAEGIPLSPRRGPGLSAQPLHVGSGDSGNGREEGLECAGPGAAAPAVLQHPGNSTWNPPVQQPTPCTSLPRARDSPCCAGRAEPPPWDQPLLCGGSGPGSLRVAPPAAGQALRSFPQTPTTCLMAQNDPRTSPQRSPLGL